MKLIDSELQYFKGNLHMHTTASDGRLAPEDAIRLYREKGYDFIVLTDHRAALPGTEYEGMQVLTGTEFDFIFPDQWLHVVGVFPDFESAQGFSREMDHKQTIKRINAVGGAAIVCHPAWSLNTPEFLKNLKGICAAEVYNSISGVPWNPQRADASCVLDLTAAAGRCIPQVAADDSHAYDGEAGMSYTMVQADDCTPKSIIAALKRGSFYASQGPRFLDAEITDTELIVHTTPVEHCMFISNLPWTENRCRNISGMTESVYRLRRDVGEAFIRCEIIDAQGRHAWLSPVQL